MPAIDGIDRWEFSQSGVILSCVVVEKAKQYFPVLFQPHWNCWCQLCGLPGVFFFSLSVASAQSVCGLWAISASPQLQDFNNHDEIFVCLKCWSLLVKGTKAQFNSEVVMLKSLNWDFNVKSCTQMKIYSGNRCQFYTDIECRIHKICSIFKSLCSINQSIFI